ncbi:hypothetical protein J2X06_002546 [Lysobacter niastensis]|uniref:Uncharacterized protein n=1 Tax=Lysobacter niastensis TaxID=380629 RepID=A0ABU1WCS5_9GAMM|nr:hypothetical protein [Lysobacter niastensis]MDR7135337.1 hypothetical protein [Lysobacter niastensis]
MSNVLSRWVAPVVLAAGFGVAGLSPAQVRAAEGDDLVRVMVDVADVIFQSGNPYYRYGNGYGYDNRLTVVPDRYGRPVYYRVVPRYQSGPPYGNAYGYYQNRPVRNGHCNKHGKCKVEYYDSRYDRRYYGYDRYDRDDRYYQHDTRFGYGDRYWDNYRRHDRDDD